jgi:hypothetical protein
MCSGNVIFSLLLAYTDAVKISNGQGFLPLQAELYNNYKNLKEW